MRTHIKRYNITILFQFRGREIVNNELDRTSARGLSRKVGFRSPNRGFETNQRND